MTDRNRHIVHDGYEKTTLTEGYIRKGGNNWTSQIQTRPPAPAPMQTSTPATTSGSSNSSSGTDTSSEKK